MDSLRLEGTTIRGVVQGRKVNCVISSEPAGLTLPRGQYVLRAAEKSPVYGQLLSIEAARGPAGEPSASAIRASGDFHIKFAPGDIQDAPAGKFFDSANASGSPRVVVAAKSIGQNSLVAHAGFSDLVDLLQQAGTVALIVE